MSASLSPSLQAFARLHQWCIGSGMYWLTHCKFSLRPTDIWESNRRSVLLLTPTLQYQFMFGSTRVKRVWLQAMIIFGQMIYELWENTDIRLTQILISSIFFFFFLNIRSTGPSSKIWWAIIKKSTSMTCEKTCPVNV